MSVREFGRGKLVLGLVLGFAVLGLGTNAAAQQYTGDRVCSICHPDVYADYRQHGHPWQEIPTFVSVTVLTEGLARANEVQRIALPPTVTGDGFVLAFGGQSTATIPYSASAAAVQSALEALANIDPGDVTVTGTGPWTVEFTGQYANTNVAPLAATPTTVNVTVVREGSADQRDEVQEIALPPTVTGTGFLLAFNGKSTAKIDFSASAAVVQSALEALANINPGDVAVTGTGPWRVEFTGQYANTNVARLAAGQVPGPDKFGFASVGVGLPDPAASPVLPNGWADVAALVGNFKEGEGFFVRASDGRRVEPGGATAGTYPPQCFYCHNPTGYQPAGTMYGIASWANGAPALDAFGNRIQGVQCEHCHGPFGPMPLPIPPRSICRDCHSTTGPNPVTGLDSDPNKRIPFAPLTADGPNGVFTNHHPEGDEFRRSPHKKVVNNNGFVEYCLMCHEAHKSVWHDKGGIKFAQPGDEEGQDNMCKACHQTTNPDYPNAPKVRLRGTMGEIGIACVECHMPEKTAGSQTKQADGTYLANGPEGERHTHLFKINPTALKAVDNVTPVVTGTGPSWKVEFTGQYAKTNVATLAASPTFAKVTVLSEGSADRNEVQQIALPPAMTGEESMFTFTLAFGGESTATIPYSASAAAVRSALEALATINPGDVTVTGTPANPTITRYWNSNDPDDPTNPTALNGDSFLTLDLVCTQCHDIDKFPLEDMANAAKTIHRTTELLDLTVNGSDTLQIVKTTDVVKVAFSVDAGEREGMQADWFVISQGPRGWTSWDGKKWKSGLKPWRKGAALADVQPQTVLNSKLATGHYTYWVGVFPEDGSQNLVSVPVYVTKPPKAPKPPRKTARR